MPSSTPDPGQLGHEALAYASRGIKVFPLWWAINGACACRLGAECSRPAKHSRVNHWNTEATSNPRQVEAWWAMWPHANIGLPAGDNGLAVADVDPRHDGDTTLGVLAQWLQRSHNIDLFATRIIRTGSGGLHLYYRQPPGGITSKARAFDADGVDTRGRGGYVVAPPSVHACGGRYEIIDGQAVAPWPAPLTGLMEPAPDTTPTRGGALPPGTIACGPRPAGPQDRAVAWAFAALLGECENIRQAPKGERNHTLNKAAYKIGCKVAAGHLDETAAADALYAAAAGWIGDECSAAEIRTTIRSGLQAGARVSNPQGPANRAGATS